MVPMQNMATMAKNMGLLRPFVLRRRNKMIIANEYKTREMPRRKMSGTAPMTGTCATYHKAHTLQKCR